jgi:putative hydrolase of HD superfamily
MDRIVEFLFEAGMLKRTPRTGYQFFGSGRESVADHVMRTAIIGYTLARLDGSVDEAKVIKMCLFHDLPEARTGDQNYVNKRYVTTHEKRAIRDMCLNLPFGDDISSLIEEFNNRETPEAKLVYDADQLDLLINIKELGDIGNPNAVDWIYHAVKRLQTDLGKKIARKILDTDSTAWWFGDKKGDYWSQD